MLNGNKTLYIAMVDIKKIYASLDRKKLIEVLIKYKVKPNIIRMIVQIYVTEKITINDLGVYMKYNIHFQLIIISSKT